MLHDKEIREGRSQRYLLYTHTHPDKHSEQNKEEKLMTIKDLILVTGQVVVAGISSTTHSLPSVTTSHDNVFFSWRDDPNLNS